MPEPDGAGAARVAVLGPHGFIGARVVSAARARGLHVTGVPGLRVPGGDVPDVDTAAQNWRVRQPEAFERLCGLLEGHDVVVDAAGVARPESTDTRELRAGNAVHPAVLALAANEAGVRRFVHVSSAVVQGRLDPLDESPRHFPLSPYASSKAEAETFLLAGKGVPPEVVVYRPTSIQDASRGTTRRLARMLALPVVPVVGRGDQHVPVALVENVAAGIVFAATMPQPSPIVLQPSEGMTARGLVEVFAAGRVVSVPARPALVARRALVGASTANARITPLARRLELMLWGQEVDATALTRAGFVAPAGREGWEALAAQLRGDRVAARRNGDSPG